MRTLDPDLRSRRTPKNSLRGHSWGNRPDIWIIFLANFGILIWIVPPPYLKISKFYPDYREIASKIRITEWRCRCVGYRNNFLFHTCLEFTHKSTIVWTFAGKLNQKRIQYFSLDLIRIVGTTLSGQPAYAWIIQEQCLAKIEIFIRICRRPQPKFAIFIWTFR